MELNMHLHLDPKTYRTESAIDGGETLASFGFAPTPEGYEIGTARAEGGSLSRFGETPSSVSNAGGESTDYVAIDRAFAGREERRRTLHLVCSVRGHERLSPVTDS
ncbi:unnamed protein product [Didymodactylos carnosus]|uniref:Uncharacterized protein n=1 Tax=Didymodactylos carnosus TaxID=1234261 RepID=A0A816DWB0_9BILA|nr:unnamed protein product [Didymodactylos carnosus]CAF4550307.1 unnamed protein product [Didymodactylos carnosus]